MFDMEEVEFPAKLNFSEFKKILGATNSEDELFHAVVNAPFHDPLQTSLIFLGIVVLLLVNKETGMIDRIAVTDNELAAGTKKMSVKKFEEIKIPVGHTENIIAKAIESGEPQGTGDWQYLFTPALTAQEARFNQAGGGIGYSAVYPLKDVRDGGALIFSYFLYPKDLGSVQRDFMEKYTKLVSEWL